MDLRVVAAVLLTLFAVGVLMAEGDVSADDLMDNIRGLSGEFSVSDLLAENATPTPNNTVSADLTVDDLSVSLGVDQPATVRFTPTDTTTLTAADSQVSVSPGNVVTLHEYTGSVDVANGTLTVDGGAPLITAGGVTLNYSTAEPVSATDARFSEVHVTRIVGQPFTFSNASGTLTAGGKQITLQSDRAAFTVFSGNVTLVAPGTVRLDGRVEEAVLGTGDARITIGG